MLEKHIGTRTGDRSDRIAASSPAFVGLRAEQDGLRDKWPKTKQKHALDTCTVHAKDIHGRRALAFDRVSVSDVVEPERGGAVEKQSMVGGDAARCGMMHRHKA